MKKFFTLIAASAISIAATAQEQAPAFPGAEGHGRYTTGGRGGKVIHVTNLNDSGTGSLRAAVSGSSKKIVVFDVSGYIDLKSDLKVGPNTTIAGQTAPGDGITLRYYTLRPNGNNIIIRFIRSRRSQVKDVNDGADAMFTRHFSDMMIDHCSFSWSIDEVASVYDNRNFSMQWCNITEGLANPGHTKGAHSYGGIWGGKDASFHHNFIAHVQNRAPRFNGARYGWDGYDKTKYESTVQAERVDFRNCVMYNWGTGSACYGGPGGGYINIVNNYYKAGPGTKNKTTVTQVTVATSGNADSKHPELYGYSSRYYVSGNYVTAASKPENYDWSGVKYDNGLYTINGDRYIKDTAHLFGANETYVKNSAGDDCIKLKLDTQTDPGTVTTHDAKTSFDKILLYCGASLAKDGVDLRNMEEARTGTTTFNGNAPYTNAEGTTFPASGTKGIIDYVNDPDKAENTKTASYPVLNAMSRPAGFDTDGDGMPDEWEIVNGLNPNDAADGNLYTLDTEKQWYTNVEVYMNSIVEHIVKAQNEDAIDAVNEYYPAFTAGIKDVEADNSHEVITIEYYSLDGRRIPEPANGITIRRIVYADGRVEADKVIK